jgi:hypothetical protein
MIEGHLTLLATNPITKYSKKPAEGGGGEKKKTAAKGTTGLASQTIADTTEGKKYNKNRSHKSSISRERFLWLICQLAQTHCV